MSGKSLNIQGGQHYGAVPLYIYFTADAKFFLREIVAKTQARTCFGWIMWFQTREKYAILNIPAAPYSLSAPGCQMNFKIPDSYVALRGLFILDVEFDTGPHAFVASRILSK